MTLLFKNEYVEQILRGRKTATRRLARPMVKVGGEYHIRVNFFKYLPERIRVTRLYTQALGEMTPRDAEREGFASQGEFMGAWRDIYGEWDPSQRVWVVEFECIGADRNV